MKQYRKQDFPIDNIRRVIELVPIRSATPTDHR